MSLELMMAQPGSSSPVSVISPRFCVPRSVDLAITKKVWQSRDSVINDSDGNLMFKVETSFFRFDRMKAILDASDLPIVTLRKKTFSAHTRWEVFKGESTENKDKIFSARRSSMIQMRTKLHVFLANNTSEDVCDYSVQASWFGRSCKVYVGDSSIIIAQVQENFLIGSRFNWKEQIYGEGAPKCRLHLHCCSNRHS